MSDRWLATFPGKYGDILWSLATVRLLGQVKGGKVDFAIMPQYRPLLPLLNAQEYIGEARVVEDWQLMHSNYGDQPWMPPRHVEEGYDRIWHLGYRGHPGMGATKAMALVDFVADQQGFKFVEPPVPFLEVPDGKKLFPYVEDGQEREKAYFVVGFNEQYADLKEAFKKTLFGMMPDEAFVDLTTGTWLEAAQALKRAIAFVGCRSAMAVVAHGLGKKVFTYEPHPQRHMAGMFGTVFGFPYGTEVTAPMGMPPQVAAQVAAVTLSQWRQENENAKTIAG